MVVKQTPDYCQKGVTSRCFFEQQNCWLKNPFRRKIKPKNPRKGWWIPDLKRICLNKENAQHRRLRRKTNKIVNFPLERLSQPCKLFLPNPPPLIQISVDFVLRQEVQKSFLHLLHQSAEFYLRLQSSCFFRTDFHFRFIELVEKVHH